jgi:hypothetical protein
MHPIPVPDTPVTVAADPVVLAGALIEVQP